MIKLPSRLKFNFLTKKFQDPGGLITLMINALLIGFCFQCIGLTWLQISADAPVVQGIVTNKSLVEGSYQAPHYASVTYSFETPQQETYYGTSYVFGKRTPEIGENIDIRYNPNSPNASVAVRMSTYYINSGLVVGTFVWLLGSIVYFIITMQPLLRKVRLIESGVIVAGSYSKKRKTNMEEGIKRIYRVYFEFLTTEGKSVTTFIETHRVKSVTDEKRELLIYDPQDPEIILLVDDFPAPMQRYLRDVSSKTYTKV